MTDEFVTSTRAEQIEQLNIGGVAWNTEQPRHGEIMQMVSKINHGNIKLNLGCGIKRFHMPEWINIDHSIDCNPDLILDVENEEFPFNENSVAEIRADNLLEHFSSLTHCMNECWTVLKPGGVFWFRVPAVDRFEIEILNPAYLSTPQPAKIRMYGAFRDPTHKKFFCEGTMDYWNGDHQTWKNYGKSYGFRPWKVDTKVFHNPKNGLFFYDVTQLPTKD